jgi:hypothetical protein
MPGGQRAKARTTSTTYFELHAQSAGCDQPCSTNQKRTIRSRSRQRPGRHGRILRPHATRRCGYRCATYGSLQRERGRAFPAARQERLRAAGVIARGIVLVGEPAPSIADAVCHGNERSRDGRRLGARLVGHQSDSPREASGHAGQVSQSRLGAGRMHVATTQSRMVVESGSSPVRIVRSATPAAFECLRLESNSSEKTR